MGCGGSIRARAVSRRVACRPVRASCNRRESRRGVRRRPSEARPRRPWRSPPRRTARAPSRSSREPAGYLPPAAALRSCCLPCSSPAPLRSLSPMEIPALPPGLLDQNDVRDFHPFIEGFAHVVDCEGRGGNGDQGFHLHARLGGGGHCGSYFHAILAQPRGHINVRQRQWMTKRYPFRGPLRRRDSRDPRHFQRIPLWILQSPHCAHDARLHLHKTPRRRRSCRHRFLRHVHHPHFAFLSVMRQLGHLCAPRLRLSSITLKHSRRSRSFLGLLAPPGNSLPSPAPRCRPSLAISTPSLPALALATPHARAKNASARAFPSKLPPAVPQPTATRAPPHRSTNQSRAPQIIQTSPSSKRDSPAIRTPACPGKFRRRRAFLAEWPPHRKRIPHPWL